MADYDTSGIVRSANDHGPQNVYEFRALDAEGDPAGDVLKAIAGSPADAAEALGLTNQNSVLLGLISLEPQAMLAPEARHWFGSERYTSG
jgi:hypothetical protein